MSEQLTVTIPAVMWKNALQKVDAHAEEIKRLAAENERLRKAGNSIALLLMPEDCSPKQIKYKLLSDWADAIERKDAK